MSDLLSPRAITYNAQKKCRQNQIESHFDFFSMNWIEQKLPKRTNPLFGSLGQWFRCFDKRGGSAVAGNVFGESLQQFVQSLHDFRM